MIYRVKSFSNVNKNYTRQFAVIHIFVPIITHLKKSGNCGMPWPKPRLKFGDEHIIIQMLVKFFKNFFFEDLAYYR